MSENERLLGELIKTGWFEYTAKGMCYKRLMDWQDVAQVGKIAAWKAFGTFNPNAKMSNGGTPDVWAWVKFKARSDMLTYVTRFKADIPMPTTINSDNDSSEFEDVRLWGAHEDDVSAIECPREAVRDAVKTLTPAQREYVTKRFWRGMTHAEISNDAGYNIGGLWYGTKGAAARLRSALREQVSV